MSIWRFARLFEIRKELPYSKRLGTTSGGGHLNIDQDTSYSENCHGFPQFLKSDSTTTSSQTLSKPSFTYHAGINTMYYE